MHANELHRYDDHNCNVVALAHLPRHVDRFMPQSSWSSTHGRAAHPALYIYINVPLDLQNRLLCSATPPVPSSLTNLLFMPLSPLFSPFDRLTL